MKHTSMFLSLSFLMLLVAGCSDSGNSFSDSGSSSSTTSSISGSGVKGPLAGAITRLYKVDLTKVDLKGDLLDEGSTSDDAAISGLMINNDLSGLLLLEFIVDVDTVEINTGNAPVFDRMITVFDVQRVYDGDSIYASPLTTMAVSLAQKKADKSSPYIGNNDGVISEAEFSAALGFAQNQTKSTVGFGLDTTVDIFVVPPMITSDTDTTAERIKVVKYRQAIEALAAVSQQVAAASTTSDDSAQTIFNALIEDLTDGDIDGQSDTGVVGTLLALDVPIETTMAAVDLSALLIPGTTTPVTDVETELAAETATTGEVSDTTELEDGTIDVDPEMPELIVDSDGDGVDDSLDAFISDSTETVDTDSDGVGDNSDAFPTDPAETVDTDGDTIGNNADSDDDNDGVIDISDAFPLDATETVDTDGDTIGNNADTDDDNDSVVDINDAFPLDATETADSDSDAVGDNRDAFPTDPALTTSLTQKAWIGANDTALSFSAGSDGVELYRSTDADCDISNYSLCADGQMDILVDGLSVTDTALNTSRAAYYTASYNGNQTTSTVSPHEVATDSYSRVIEFKGKLWFHSGDYKNEGISSSTDGINWAKHTVQYSGVDTFPNKLREGDFAVFNDKLWLIGGFRGTGYLAVGDIWSSDDGITWTLETTMETADINFKTRYGHKVTVFNGKLWVIGGYNSDAGVRLDDVWSSSDGVNWEEVTTSEPRFSARTGFSLVVFDNRMWVIAGTSDSNSFEGDVWSSDTNGIDWIKESDPAAFGKRYRMSVTQFDNKLWLIGGRAYGGDYKNDIWSYSIGTGWIQETESANFRARTDHNTFTFNNRLWLLGGTGGWYHNNSAWSSANGVDWRRETNGAEFINRNGHASVSYKGKLWVIGGYDGENALNDVWSSSDGFSWILETANAGFPPRAPEDYVLIHDDKMWLVGSGYSDVWFTEDGIGWTQVSSSFPLGEREAYAVTVAYGKMWAIGGYHRDSDTRYNDIWSSSNGITWDKEAETAAFSPRFYHQLASENDQLWLIGGHDGAVLNDVWTSGDGISWTSVNNAAAFSAGLLHSALAFNDQLLLIENDHIIWTSNDDGATWTQISDGAFFHGYRGYNGRMATPSVFDGKLFLTGGTIPNMSGSDRLVDDVWSSTDGANWRKAHQVETQF